MGQAIAAHPHLQKVKLMNNVFREDGVKAISKGFSQCRDLRYLSLRDFVSGNRANNGTPEEPRGSRALSDALRNTPRLEVLDISDCSLNAFLLLQTDDLGDDHYKAVLLIVKDSLPNPRPPPISQTTTMYELEVFLEDYKDEEKETRFIGKLEIPYVENVVDELMELMGTKLGLEVKDSYLCKSIGQINYHAEALCR
ncbi:hypothetical protein M422DRAFT_262920 [Sphaerobolus stellatus SS14]|uniref:Unplaced genomic scaffold SPHSTscaffold_119, whole genome shotgun sequence n=1 Tax=Sphaerobolus stellatus (strain SS14) TaxID=990650 RepID=A0A0C9TX27_SPHS4|nr:hypothetical protein M422DRAFT_262920 [Sphaerobolus stellatus SS14]